MDRDPYWPALLLRETAAAYLDMSAAEFGRAVARGDLPQPVHFVDRDRWSREQIDEAVRRVYGVADLKAEDGRPRSIVAQVADGGAKPESLDEVRERLGFDEIQDILRRANVVFCHGGTGSLITALKAGCRVVAMPRAAAFHEHYDDHQCEIVEAFAERGLIQMARGRADIAPALGRALAMKPECITTDMGEVVRLLNRFVDALRNPVEIQRASGDEVT